MDVYEATRIVFSRIQNLDPENASKIMGLLLFQDHGEKQMIRLAFGPETLVYSVILNARKELGLPSNSPSTPSPPSPFLSGNQVSVSRPNSTSFRLSGISIPALTIAKPSSTSATWSNLSELHNPDGLMSPNNLVLGSSTPLNSSALPFYGNEGTDFIDEFQLQDQLSFLSDASPPLGPKNPELFYPQSDLSSSPTGGNDHVPIPPYTWGGSIHRSCSLNDVCSGSDDPNSGSGWKPCLYFARGYCKNGSSCRFLHGGLGNVDAPAMLGSPSKIEMMENCHKLLRSKSAQQQRLTAASQLMAASSFPYSPKCMNVLLQQQQNDNQRAAPALVNDDLYKFGRSSLERNDFSFNGGSGIVSPASRQIYLTFPADSTFREEDVSNYFSMFGPVQDVRIPYQQKRMFGFVTFVYPETVKLILSKGNPHFVCAARVLVKPYKEKGKVPEKKQQQQVERRESSPCGTPTGVDARDPFEFQLGARMLYTQDMLRRKKLEERAYFHQALELQSRGLMSLKLLDIKKNHHHRALSTGSPIPSPVHSPNLFHQSLSFSSLHNGAEVPEENGSRSGLAISTAVPADHLPLQKTSKTDSSEEVPNIINNVSSNGENSPPNEDNYLLERCEVNCLLESLEHNLPGSPFASPTKAAAAHMTAFTNEVGDASESDAPSVPTTNKFSPATTTLDTGSFKSFHCQIPRFSSGHGTIEMFACTGGPIGI